MSSTKKSSRPAPPERPKPFAVGVVRVRIHSGPRADGRWRWRADRQAGDSREHVWTGWGTRTEAEQAVIDQLHSAGPDPREPGSIRTVADLLGAWSAAQDARTDLAASTQRTCELAVARLLGTIGDVLVDRVDRRVLERHRDRCGDAPATIARDLKYFRQAWRWGREVGCAPVVDLPTVAVARQRPVRTRYTPTRPEIASVLDQASPVVRMALVLMSTTGARIGEVLGLRWRDVAPDFRSCRVDGKTGPRDVALHPSVGRELEAWGRRRPDDLVVEVSGNRLRTVLAEWSPPGKRISPNGLRRHVVDALYRAIGPETAASQLGHSPATAMSIYRQVTDQDRARAVVAAGLSAPDRPTKVVEMPGGKR